MGHNKVEWTQETLATRVCVNGHKGNWRNVVRNGEATTAYQCRTCVAESVARHRARESGGVTFLRRGTVESLERKVQSIELQLEEAKRKLEIAKQVESLMKDF